MSERLLPPARRETGDITFRSMLALLALIGTTLVLLLLLAWWLYPTALADRRFATPFPTYPGPRLQPSPRADMDAFRVQQARDLNGTYWQDKGAGTVHLPIDQAMALVAKEGIKDWPKIAPSKTVPVAPVEGVSAEGLPQAAYGTQNWR